MANHTPLERINDFLKQHRLAMVGVSTHRKDFSRTLFRELLDRGYDMVAVNPIAEGEIEGAPTVARVGDIHPPPDGVLLMTPPRVTDAVVRECADAGIRRVWMYRATGTGAVSAEAVQFCEEKGIAVIPGECPYMFFPKSMWLHRIHGGWRKMTGAYPH